MKGQKKWLMVGAGLFLGFPFIGQAAKTLGKRTFEWRKKNQKEGEVESEGGNLSQEQILRIRDCIRNLESEEVVHILNLMRNGKKEFQNVLPKSIQDIVKEASSQEQKNSLLKYVNSAFFNEGVEWCLYGRIKKIKLFDLLMLCNEDDNEIVSHIWQSLSEEDKKLCSPMEERSKLIVLLAKNRKSSELGNYYRSKEDEFSSYLETISDEMFKELNFEYIFDDCRKKTLINRINKFSADSIKKSLGGDYFEVEENFGKLVRVIINENVKRMIEKSVETYFEEASFKDMAVEEAFQNIMEQMNFALPNPITGTTSKLRNQNFFEKQISLQISKRIIKFRLQFIKKLKEQLLSEIRDSILEKTKSLEDSINHLKQYLDTLNAEQKDWDQNKENADMLLESSKKTEENLVGMEQAMKTSGSTEAVIQVAIKPEDGINISSDHLKVLNYICDIEIEEFKRLIALRKNSPEAFYKELPKPIQDAFQVINTEDKKDGLMNQVMSVFNNRYVVFLLNSIVSNIKLPELLSLCDKYTSEDNEIISRVWQDLPEKYKKLGFSMKKFSVVIDALVRDRRSMLCGIYCRTIEDEFSAYLESISDICFNETYVKCVSDVYTQHNLFNKINKFAPENIKTLFDERYLKNEENLGRLRRIILNEKVRRRIEKSVETHFKDAAFKDMAVEEVFQKITEEENSFLFKPIVYTDYDKQNDKRIKKQRSLQIEKQMYLQISKRIITMSEHLIEELKEHLSPKTRDSILEKTKSLEDSIAHLKQYQKTLNSKQKDLDQKQESGEMLSKTVSKSSREEEESKEEDDRAPDFKTPDFKSPEAKKSNDPNDPMGARTYWKNNVFSNLDKTEERIEPRKRNAKAAAKAEENHGT